jgi:hypothetical protein
MSSDFPPPSSTAGKKEFFENAHRAFNTDRSTKAHQQPQDHLIARLHDKLQRKNIVLATLMDEHVKAEGVVVLRAAVLTRQWREALEHIRQVMATDRRLDWKWKSPDMLVQLNAQVQIGPPTPQLENAQELEVAAA